MQVRNNQEKWQRRVYFFGILWAVTCFSLFFIHTDFTEDFGGLLGALGSLILALGITYGTIKGKLLHRSAPRYILHRIILVFLVFYLCWFSTVGIMVIIAY